MRPNIQLTGKIGMRAVDLHVVNTLGCVVECDRKNGDRAQVSTSDGVAHNQIARIGPTVPFCE